MTDEESAEIFKNMAYQSSYETGLKFGFEKHYKDAKSIRNAVNNIYQRVSKNPERFGISQDVMKIVKDAMANRALVRISNNIPKAEAEIDSKDIKNTLSGVRDKAWMLIDRKLTRASKSNKRLDDISLQQLGTIAGIAFDKSQILSGQATENIAVMGKIEGNINPQDALDLVLRMREANVAAKQK